MDAQALASSEWVLAVTWFSLWPPLVLQLVLPLLLAGWVAVGRGPRRTRIASAVLSALYLVAIGLAGLWLVLPWWLPFVYAVLWLVAVRRASRVLPRDLAPALARATLVLCALGVLVLTAVILAALNARRAPSDVVALAFPLQGGTYPS